MKLTVATNFEPALVEALRELPVTELYGKLRRDAAGGGRAPYQLASISRRQLARHVAHAAEAGIGFNYLLNASCMGNREITRKGQRELEALLDWVCEIGVTAVTVATPYMLRLIKARYPMLKVRVSVFAGIDRVRKAQMWEELGADCLVMDSLLVNRELKTLERIRKHVDCELELLINNSCLQSCALSPMHMNALAHAAQDWHQNDGFLIDWCFLRCTATKLREPVNYIRSEWIRPEDLHVYEDLGFDRFKIVERDIPTSILVKRVRAYAARRYDGNLLDLVQPYAFSATPDDKRHTKRGLAWAAFVLRYLFRPRLANPLRMGALKRLAEIRGMLRPLDGQAPVHIDNRALDGFIERFRSRGCRDDDCGTCGWCARFAEQAVKLEPVHRAEALAAYDEVFEALEGGSMWRYLGKGSRRASHAGCCDSPPLAEPVG